MEDNSDQSGNVVLLKNASIAGSGPGNGGSVSSLSIGVERRLTALETHLQNLATKTDLSQMEVRILSAITSQMRWLVATGLVGMTIILTLVLTIFKLLPPGS